MQTPALFKIFKFMLLVGINVFLLKLKMKKVMKIEETSLKCSHKEVDFPMLFRAKFISAPNTLVKRTVDTDILVITLCNKPKLFQRLKARLEVQLTSNNILRYLNVNEINQSLGYRLCCALPGYHTFTDCDFTALFSRKGKVS